MSPTSPGDTTYGVHFSDRSLDSVLPVFRRLAKEYSATWGVPCLLVTNHGQVISGPQACLEGCPAGPKCGALRRQAIEEAVRWGEPYIHLCPGGGMIWAVPVMQNQKVLGGIIAGRSVREVAEDDQSPISAADVTEAAADLMRRAAEANLTNAALLELRRLEAQRQSSRAEAIHALKDHNYQSIRDVYLVEEPALVAAIKRGDRATAREIINRILVGIYFMGRERPLLLKSFLLELVVNMSRTAVEAGADPTELLGANYSAFTDLASIEGEEKLCAWLVDLLERIMDAIHAHHHYPIGVLLSEAIRHMQDHLSENLARDEVARIACLSPTHFSRVVKQTFGHSFTELLQQLRVDRAREMLAVSERSLVEIGLECGFADQSYFTKVFQKVTGQTPGEYRRLARSKVS